MKNNKKTVSIDELSSIKMAGKNGKKYPKVIHDKIVKQWVGIGWCPEGEATKQDYKKYPVVVK